MPLSPLIREPLNFLGSVVTNTQVTKWDDQIVPCITKKEFGNLIAIAGYAKRDGFFGGIATLFHRIWNAVKAIFGQSDWQKAVKTLVAIDKRVQPYLINKNMRQIHGKKDAEKYVKGILHSVNAYNKLVKPVEKAALPMVRELISMIDKGRLADQIFDLKDIFSDILSIKSINQARCVIANFKSNGLLKSTADGNKIINTMLFVTQLIDKK